MFANKIALSKYAPFLSSGSYGSGLSTADKTTAYKTLTGTDYNIFDAATNRTGFKTVNNDLKELENLYEWDPIRSGFKGVAGYTPVGLKTSTGLGLGGLNASEISSKASGLTDTLTESAYDKAVKTNLFQKDEATAEEMAKFEAEHGPQIKDWNKYLGIKNVLTGDREVISVRDRPTESNFWRKYKDPLIRGAGGVLGGIIGSIVPVIGTAYGAMVGQQLAGTIRDAYKANVDRKKYLKAKKEFEAEQARIEQERLAAEEAKKGNLYRGVGEGFVEFATKDKTNLNQGTYVR